MIAHMSIEILMPKQHISLLSTTTRRKNILERQILAGSKILPHCLLDMCEILFLNIFFLMRPVRLDFTNVHQLKWFGAGRRKRGG